MPNLCFDDICFYSDTNPQGLSELWYDLERSIVICPHHALSWIGNLFAYKKLNTDGIGLRGNISFMERNDDNILISADTAWSPLYDAYAAIARAYGVSFVMESIEPGFNIYYNTDESGIFFPDKYLVKIDDESLVTPSGSVLSQELENGEPFPSEESLLQKFSELGYHAKSIQELQEMLDEKVTICEFTNPYRNKKIV